MNNIADSFNTAMNAINVAQATNDFFPAPPASTFEDTLILSIVAGIMGLFGGLIGAAEGTAVAGALISGITGGALGVANTCIGRASAWRTKPHYRIKPDPRHF